MRFLARDIELRMPSTDLQFKADVEVALLKTSLQRLGCVISGLSKVNKPSVTAKRADLRDVTITPKMFLDIKSTWITGSIFLDNGKLVLCDGANEKLLLLSQDLQLEHELKLSGK